MSTQHDDGDGFWGGERDWTDSHRRQSPDHHTTLGDRLRTGVNSVLDVGASGGRRHGDSGRTPVVEPASQDESADWSPQSDVVGQTAAGLSIGELTMPWDGGADEPTMPIDHTNVAVAERPPEFDAAPLEDDPAPVSDGRGGEAEWGDEWAPETHPVPPPRGGVDPLLAKFGVVAVVLTLLVPFALSLRGNSSDRLVGASETASTLGVLDLFDGEEGTSEETSASDDGGAEAATASASATADQAADAAATGSESSAAAVEIAAEPVVEESCSVDYDVVAGDYWLRLAEGAGVPLADLLHANGATSSTPLYPGRTICLPAGSSTPPPPPPPSTSPPAASTSSGSSSAASSTGSSSSSKSSGTSKSSSSSKSSSTPAATTPPTTHAPPPPPPPPSPSAGAVEQIIRSVWPDELEDKALAIAWRESNYKANAKNYCCYGLFQIYYSVHQSWLAGIGITSGNQLYDAQTNARAAYTLYQRAGGWGPWGG